MAQNLKLVGIVLAALVLGVWIPGFVLFRSFEHQIAPAKPEPTRPEVAAKELRDAMPRNIMAIAQKIEAGDIPDWPAAREALNSAGDAQAKIFAESLNAAERANTTDKGAFTDRKAAADLLRKVAHAWE